MGWGDYNTERIRQAGQFLQQAGASRRAGWGSLSDSLNRARETLMWSKGQKQEREEAQKDRDLKEKIQRLSDEANMARTQYSEAAATGRQASVNSAAWDRVMAQLDSAQRLASQGYLEDAKAAAAKAKADMDRMLAEQGEIAGREEAGRTWSQTEAEKARAHELGIEKIRSGRGDYANVGSEMEEFRNALDMFTDMNQNADNYDFETGTWKPDKYERLRESFAAIISRYPQDYQDFMLANFDAWLKNPQAAGLDTFGSDLTTPQTTGPLSGVNEFLSNLPVVKQAQGVGDAINNWLENRWKAAPGAAAAVVGTQTPSVEQPPANVMTAMADELGEMETRMALDPKATPKEKRLVQELQRDINDGVIERADFQQKYEQLRNKWLTSKIATGTKTISEGSRYGF